MVRTRNNVLAFLLFAAAVLWSAAHGPLQAQNAHRMNRMIEALETGKVAITGETWTWIEQEHEPYAIDKLAKAVTAVLSKRNAQGQAALAPFVRIPMEGDQESRWAIKQVLETGAMGVIVPQVESGAQALTLVHSMRYPQKTGSKHMEPRGRRGFGGVPAGWMVKNPVDYYEKLADVWPLSADGELFLMPMIETPEGLRNLGAILSTPGVGGIIIGPGDLNMNLGNGGGARGASTEQAIATVLTTCAKMKKYCGMVETTPEGIRKYTDLGARFFFAAAREGATFSPARNF